jgi:hypothetical protein
MAVSDFWIYFFATNFPNALDCSTDITLSELIEEKYTVSKNWVIAFTQYDKNTHETNDGYLESPNTFVIELWSDDVLTIEFHSGDTIYFINEEKLGCTGSHFFIQKISLQRYNELVSPERWENKVLLLPMVSISKSEIEKFKNLVTELLIKLPFAQDDNLFIQNAIAENCLNV